MKKILASLGIGSSLILGGVDASKLEEKPIDIVQTIASEQVEAKQVGNVVETTLPWKGEEGIKVKYDMGEPDLAEKLTDKRKKQVVTETVTDFDGGFKVDIVLSERPDSNVFCYEIEGHENYDFFYQSQLSEEQMNEGWSQSPEIEGSYAVYHKTLQNNEVERVATTSDTRFENEKIITQEELEAGFTDGSIYSEKKEGEDWEYVRVVHDYKTGKVMHIPRPQVWEIGNEDATTVWADISYDTGQLCVTVPQDYLDKADYTNGVRVDPTFGYTSIGGSNLTIGDADPDRDWLGGSSASSTETGTIDNVTAALHMRSTSDSSVGIRINIYELNDGGANTHSLFATYASSSVNLTTAYAWKIFPFAGETVVVDDYILGATSQGSSMAGTGFADVAGDFTSQVYYSDLPASATYYATPPDPWVLAGTGTGRVSIYVTYTASGGVATPTPHTYINGNAYIRGNLYIGH